MKDIFGLIAAFFTMTAFIGLSSMGVLVFFFGLIAFITWSFPVGIYVENIMLALRACLGIGSIFGIFFVFSKEGLELAKDYANMFSKESGDE
jgi:hypothetical protein